MSDSTPAPVTRTTSNDSSSTMPAPTSPTQAATGKTGRGRPFWFSMTALAFTVLLSALDLTAVSTALPTIAADLDGGDSFVWVGSAYALASTAFLPLSGALADIFGRRPVLLISIGFFALGSALAGAAQNMDMMIAARTIQGIGGGGILNLTEIVVSDLVPLAERGIFQGFFGMIWAFASGVGPTVGGALASKGHAWRWLFYLNLPFTGLAAALVIVFLQVKTPEGSIKSKLARVDWTGNLIVIAGATLAILGLTWGGVHYPWSSAEVLAPLLIGFALIVLFVIYELKVPREPTIPFAAISNRTSFSGYIATAIHGITSMAIIYYLPVYFQAVKGASPIRSAVDMLPTALVIAPFATVCGIVVQVTNKYRPSNFTGWVLIVVGFGILTLLQADSSTGQWVGYQLVVSAGIGIMFTGSVFPVLAPLPVTLTAPSLAFFSFVRAFSQTWGITISSTILQNQLSSRLPSEFTSQFPGGVEIAFAAIPIVKTLPEPLRGEVQRAFVDSLRVVWQAMIGIAGIGLLSVLLLREVPMNTYKDDSYGLKEDISKVENAEEKV